VSSLTPQQQSPNPALHYEASPVERLVNGLPLLAERLMLSPFRRGDHLQAIIDEAEAIERPRLDEVGRLSRLATSDDIQRFVLMIAAVWNSGQRDLSGFAAQLGETILRLGPSSYALIEGGNRLQATFKWTPSIAEILPVLREIDFRVERARTAQSDLPARIAAAKQSLLREREREALEMLEYEQARAAWFAEQEARERGTSH
jgi:thioredoxin-like negative regulator of GroEL